MRLADYVVKRLKDEGIGQCFLVNGRALLHLTDALARSDLKTVCCHHEQAAGFAAIAAAQLTHEAGLCMVSAGCAAANALTPLLCAYQDEVPLLVISGQHSLRECNTLKQLPIRTFGQQETNIIAAAKPWCKGTFFVDDPNLIEEVLAEAFYLLKEGRPGPVWIDIPIDVQGMRVDEESLAAARKTKNDCKAEAQAKDQAAQSARKILEHLAKAKRPLLMVGGELNWSQCAEEIRQWACKLRLPVIYDGSACDLMGQFPGLIGLVSSVGGSRCANLAAANCDLLLCLGCKLNSQTLGPVPHKFAREAKIIAVSVDENEFLKGNLKLEQTISADLKALSECLLEQSGGFKLDDEARGFYEYCLKLKEKLPLADPYIIGSWEAQKSAEDNLGIAPPVDLYKFAGVLSEELSEHGVFITDAGLEELIFPSVIRFKDGTSCLQCFSQGSMGFALPAVTGAAACTAAQIVCAVGDGSVMFNLQELQTIRSLGVKAKIFIINNNGYAVIRDRQTQLFRRRTLGNDPSDGLTLPDFEKIAGAFDFAYEKLHDCPDLKEQVHRILQRDGAVICEVMARPDQPYLHSSYGRTCQGKFVQRAIEDLSPLLPLETLQELMLVPVIDR